MGGKENAIMVGIEGSPAPIPYFQIACWDRKKLVVKDTFPSEKSLLSLAPYEESNFRSQLTYFAIVRSLENQ